VFNKSLIFYIDSFDDQRNVFDDFTETSTPGPTKKNVSVDANQPQTVQSYPTVTGGFPSATPTSTTPPRDPYLFSSPLNNNTTVPRDIDRSLLTNENQVPT
jgi:hypothetical protein